MRCQEADPEEPGWWDGPFHARISTLLANPELPRARRYSMRVSFYAFFPGGGIGRYMHEVLCAFPEWTNLDFELICAPEFEWTSSARYPVWPGLSCLSHNRPVIRRYRFIDRQFRNPIAAIRRAKETGSGILHFSLANHISYWMWEHFLTRSGLKITATVHDVRRGKAILNKRFEDTQLARFYRSADALFVHSPVQVHELESFAAVDPSRIHVLPHGPYAFPVPQRTRQHVRADWGFAADSLVGLAFGTVRDDKNLSGLLHALTLVPQNIKLVVAGRAASGHAGVSAYRELSHRLGLDQRVIFADRYIPDEEVGEFFVAADWVALPYLSSFTSQSGVLNAAMHFRRPVLVSPAPALRETVTSVDVGVASEDDGPSGIAEGIRCIYDRLHDSHVHDFEGYLRLNSWRANVERTYSVFQNISV